VHGRIVALLNIVAWIVLFVDMGVNPGSTVPSENMKNLRTFALAVVLPTLVYLGLFGLVWMYSKFYVQHPKLFWGLGIVHGLLFMSVFYLFYYRYELIQKPPGPTPFQNGLYTLALVVLGFVVAILGLFPLHGKIKI
jgi:hypothetical protein